jgi:hypothetical protein
MKATEEKCKKDFGKAKRSVISFLTAVKIQQSDLGFTRIM